MKYRIFVSDTESPENVKEFCIESEKPVEEIVKAAALQEVQGSTFYCFQIN